MRPGGRDVTRIILRNYLFFMGMRNPGKGVVSFFRRIRRNEQFCEGPGRPPAAGAGPGRPADRTGAAGEGLDFRFSVEGSRAGDQGPARAAQGMPRPGLKGEFIGELYRKADRKAEARFKSDGIRSHRLTV